MLLPHGYEGQGPEHSSARPERFLQLSAEWNIVVANITEPSNFFHLLRRQLTWPFRKPLIVFSPKSLLRHPKVLSPINEFTKGRFKEVLPDNYATTSKVKRVVLCTGKFYYDLIEEREKNKRKDVAIIRIEQLHPFPEIQVEDEIAKYKDAVIVWSQEEPHNMGYWTYINRIVSQELKNKMQLVSRKWSASPATGYSKVHSLEQEQLIKATLG